MVSVADIDSRMAFAVDSKEGLLWQASPEEGDHDYERQGMMPVYEDALEALHRGFNNTKRKPKNKADMNWIPPEGSCDLCGGINVYKDGLCLPCWRLDRHRKAGG